MVLEKLTISRNSKVLFIQPLHILHTALHVISKKKSFVNYWAPQVMQ